MNKNNERIKRIATRIVKAIGWIAVSFILLLLIPIGVLLHELGHALATWQVGGQVREFQWRVFWGYIVPEGSFSPTEDWWISLSGNLVSVALGLLAIPLVPLLK